jgi:hypothetical protein
MSDQQRSHGSQGGSNGGPPPLSVSVNLSMGSYVSPAFIRAGPVQIDACSCNCDANVGAGAGGGPGSLAADQGS